MVHLGDITKIHGDKIEPVDCITFGSPCQDLSIAGRRAGLAGERSGLFMEAVRIIKEMRKATDGVYPTFAIWENVPGAFSSNNGEDFRAVLEELARVEQPEAIIPRPPRGADGAKPEQSPEMDGLWLGDSWTVNISEWPSAESVSLLSQTLEVNAPEKYYLSARACQGILTRASRRGKKLPDLLQTALLEMIEWWQRGGRNAYTLKIRGGCAGGGKGALVQTEKVGTLSTLQDQTVFQPIQVTEAIPINTQIATRCISLGERTGQRTRWIVRRLTPTECERLQGYPDGWTDIGEWTDTKGKKHKPADSPRYKALGNSIALPQWFWIAQKMKLYMGDGAKLGSLFDGIGGFPLVWETTYGAGTARWASEIEEFPIAVTKKHFPERKEYEN